jgi:hypothetical protein
MSVGGLTGDWSEAASRASGTVPTASDNVVFDDLPSDTAAASGTAGIQSTPVNNSFVAEWRADDQWSADGQRVRANSHQVQRRDRLIGAAFNVGSSEPAVFCARTEM